jgi:hypothetical protein
MTPGVQGLSALRARSERRNRGPPGCARVSLERERPGWHPVSQNNSA